MPPLPPGFVETRGAPLGNVNAGSRKEINVSFRAPCCGALHLHEPGRGANGKSFASAASVVIGVTAQACARSGEQACGTCHRMTGVCGKPLRDGTGTFIITWPAALRGSALPGRLNAEGKCLGCWHAWLGEEDREISCDMCDQL